MKSIKRLIPLVMMLAFVLNLTLGMGFAHAAGNSSNNGNGTQTGTQTPSDSLNSVINVPTGNGNGPGNLDDNIKEIISLVRKIGIAVIFVFFLITAAMFAAARDNPQKRGGAFLSLVGCIIAIYLTMNAESLTVYFANM